MTSPRVVVLSLNHKPSRAVQSYVGDLLDAGVTVDLLVTESKSTEETDIDETRVRVRRVYDVEAEVGLRKFERIVIFSIPNRVYGAVRGVTQSHRALFPLDVGVRAVRKGQHWFSNKFHRAVFWPAYKKARPLLMIRSGKKPADSFDLSTADRIVAADFGAIPLAWRLAKRYPNVRATTALDRRPYI